MKKLSTAHKLLPAARFMSRFTRPSRSNCAGGKLPRERLPKLKVVLDLRADLLLLWPLARRIARSRCGSSGTITPFR